MKRVLLGLTAALVAGLAVAQDAPPAVDPALRSMAEGQVRARLTDPDSAEFRGEGSTSAPWIKHGAFGKKIDGPVSIICGQVNAKNRMGGYSGYAWFLSAVKDGQPLWTDLDDSTEGPGMAYYGCRNAGLAD